MYKGPRPMTREQLDHFDGHCQKEYLVQVRARGDPGYNCHGMTFAARHGWIDSGKQQVPHIIAADWDPAKDPRECTRALEELLRSSGLRRVASLPNFRVDRLQKSDDVAEGDVILYRLGIVVTHSGIVWRREGSEVQVLSKWGIYGEYFHAYRAVPEEMYGTAVEFWSDRKGE